MLTALHIENIAVIKKLDVDFSGGFTVLTGETGAGKSILIDSVAFLLGAKAQRELIRTGEDKALVSGFFTAIPPEVTAYLGEYGVALEDGSLTILRTLSADGRTTVKINGRTVSSTVGRNAGMGLINIHGQHDNQVLQNPSHHIGYLDRYAENEAALAVYAALYRQYQKIRAEIRRLTENERDKERRKELLAYQIQDIEAAALSEGEEEKLLSRKKLLLNTKQVSKQVLTAYRALYKNSKGPSASQLTELAADAVTELSTIFPEAEKIAERLSDMQAELEKAAKEITTYMPTASENPEKELEEIDERLDEIRRMKRKYGASCEEVLAFLEKCRDELRAIESSDETLENLTRLLEEKKSELLTQAEALHEHRVRKGEELSEKICEVLGYLDMEKVRFSVRIDRKPGEDGGLSADGYDDAAFYIATNPGEPMKPLARIASGGELSRIMLAIKCVLAGAESVPSIVFDEIDTGVSGKTSQKIGIKLSALARSTQVICITHSAQIAALADRHFKIVKEEKDDRVETTLRELDDPGRIDELSRIIGGVSITEKTRETAREMLETSRAIVSSF